MSLDKGFPQLFHETGSSVTINFTFNINVLIKDSIKSLPCKGYRLPYHELIKFVKVAKWAFKLPSNQQLRFLIFIV